ncbi:STM4504/CBY_0614 family protein [Altericista sp. CCNU0014]|uniref:STM4504/CBY_0614 family protein n=1 Tax=Altericista sp. CCNU0014 TaxID=3082949 RepID=UPI00384B813A
MPIIDLYSKRKKCIEKGDQPEIYQYDDLPIAFRRQIVHIWDSAIGVYLASSFGAKIWCQVHNLLTRELGLFELSSGFQVDPFEQCKEFLLHKGTSVENQLDLIELTFKFINVVIRQKLEKPIDWDEIDFKRKLSQQPDEAISELNYRFREHGIGYQFEGGQIIRVDSKFIHAEVVVPALGLLSNSNFIGPEQEFRSAHEHYRRQEYKDAIVDALNSFESTIKSICDVRGWEYSKTATAQKLIEVIFAKELIPKYLQDYFSGLRNVLVSGVPTVRNKTSGHGQGAIPVEVPEHLAAYVLHLTAANIVMLIEAHKAQP